MALEQLWAFHFDYLPRVLAKSVFELVPKELIQRHFAEAIQTVVQTTHTDPAKCRTLAKAYLLLDDRPRSLEWLRTAIRLEPCDPECLCLLAGYEIARGQHSEALNHLTRSIHAEPNSIAALHNYHAAKLDSKNAFVEFGNVSEWFLLCMLSEKDLVGLDEVPELTTAVRRSILEEVLKDDPLNLNVREALLPFLPYEQQIALGEELAYEIDEQTNATRLPTKIAGMLQYAYLQQARENSGVRQNATKRGIQWTEFLIKAGVRDIDTLYVGASLMFDPDDKGRAAVFLKDHLDVILTNVELTRFYCNCLKPEDAILILERVLSEKRAKLSRKELDTIHWALAHHYKESGEPDKTISLYRLATDFQDKEALSTYLFRVRELKGNPSAYQEALRLLAENGETLATLSGIAEECFWNKLWTDEVRYLKKAIAIAPNDADICDRIAFAYGMLDQEEEAAYWDKKALLLASV